MDERRICLLFCFLFLIQIVNGKNGSSTISDWLETQRDLAPEEERSLENKLMNMMEMFLEFAEVTVQIDTKVDEIMALEEPIAAIEVDEFLSSCNEMKELLISKSFELEQDPDRMNPEKWAFFDTLPDTFAKLTATSSEMSSKILKANEEAKNRLAELGEATAKSTELVDLILSYSKEIGFPVGFNMDPAAPMDASTIKTKGKVMVKTATLFVMYFNRLLATANKLEILGYYDNDPALPTDESQKSIEVELGVIEATKKSLIDLMEQVTGVMGQNNLLSYAMETIQFTKSKLPLLEQQRRERHETAMKTLTLVGEAYKEISKYIPRPFNSAPHQEL